MDIKSTVKNYILREFLPGEDAENLEDETPLIASGILDSLATMQLVSFLEGEFGVAIAPHETDPEYIGTINAIEQLIQSKSSS